MLVRENKIVLLFCSELNPLWSLLLGRKALKKDVFKLLGISHQTLANWERGATISERTLVSMIHVLDKYIGWRRDPGIRPEKKDEKDDPIVEAWDAMTTMDEERFERIERLIDYVRISLRNTSNLTLESFSTQIEMNVDDAQRLIDNIIYRLYPGFHHLLYEGYGRDEKRAVEDITRYRGLYNVYLERGDGWIRCPLHVKYLVEISTNKAIRCRFNIPSLDSNAREDNFFIYDGFLGVKAMRLFWIMEERKERLADFITIVTDRGKRYASGLAMVGSYLTTDQTPLKKPVMGKVLMSQHVSGNTSALEFMRTSPGVIESGRAKAEVDHLYRDVASGQDDYAI